MILTRLYQLAMRPGETILDDPAFEDVPIPYVVSIGENGEYLGVQEQRGTITIPARKKGAPPKQEQDKGYIRSVPRAHGNTASQGFARYFADTLPRVLLTVHDLTDWTDETKKQSEVAKRTRSYQTFWKQLSQAASETGDPALKAIAAFGKKLQEDDALATQVRSEVAAQKPDAGDRCTFAWYPDNGKIVLERPSVREWFAKFMAGLNAGRQEAGPVGVCQVTGQIGPLPTSHPIKFQSVPGGMSVGVSLVSFDKAAFQHYGLDGAANAGIGYPATEAYSRALTALIQNQVKGNNRTSLRVGGSLFLFWTRDPADTGFVAEIEDPFSTPDTSHAIAEYQAIQKGEQSTLDPDPNQFYVLALSANAARAVVRDYLERPLAHVRDCVRTWFNDLRIADASKSGVPTDRFPLWLLANATATEADRVAPDIHTRLMEAALLRTPLPDSVLIACLGRLRVPERDPNRTVFTVARLGLIKLCLKRKGLPVSEMLNTNEHDPAYVYGRLLRVFEEIQYAALGDVNANVVDKFYGTFSAAPALVFSRLFSNAQNHLRKLRGDEGSKGKGIALDRRLTELCELLPPVQPRGFLPLSAQGLFALGYYHQKAQTFAEIAERRIKKAKESESDKPTA